MKVLINCTEPSTEENNKIPCSNCFCHADVYWISKNLGWASFVLLTTNKLGRYLTCMGLSDIELLERQQESFWLIREMSLSPIFVFLSGNLVALIIMLGLGLPAHKS